MGFRNRSEAGFAVVLIIDPLLMPSVVSNPLYCGSAGYSIRDVPAAPPTSHDGCLDWVA